MTTDDDLSILRTKPFSDAVEKFENLLVQSGRAFLLGAGCSKCAGLPLTAELTAKAIESDILDATSKAILAAIERLFDGAPTSHIEDYLSELVDLLAIAERRTERGASQAQVQIDGKSYSNAQLRAAGEQIKQGISNAINKPVEIKTHRAFVHAVHRPIRVGKAAPGSMVDYLVLNYDTIVEDALATLCPPRTDGENNLTRGSDHMDIVSVINYKGGVGKTTTTANLAAQLAWIGKNVLMIDLDPQASLTFSFVRPENWETDLAEVRTIKRWFDTVREGDEMDMNVLLFEQMQVNRTLGGKGRLALIPSHLGLINVDLELATQLGGANLAQAKRNYVQVHRRLARGLADIDQDAFDIVLIDCPPNFNIVTKTAIVASHQVLVPAKPDYLSTLGITYLQRNLNQLVSDFNEYASAGVGDAVENINPQILGVIFAMVQFRNQEPITAHRGYMNQVRALEGVPVFDNYIRENKTSFGEAPETLLPVVLKRYTGQTYTNIVDELEQITDEFMTKLDATHE